MSELLKKSTGGSGSITKLTGVENLIADQVDQLNVDEAYNCLSQNDREAVDELVEKIDIRDIGQIMGIGAEKLEDARIANGELIKQYQGTREAEQVYEMVLEHAREAERKYNEFNIAIQPSSIFERLLMRIWPRAKDARDQKIIISASDCYELVSNLKDVYEKSLEELQKGYRTIYSAIDEYSKLVKLIELYCIAMERLKPKFDEEILNAEKQYENTHLLAYKNNSMALNRGLEILNTMIANFKVARCTTQLSIQQLRIIEGSNLDIQVHIKNINSLAIINLGQNILVATLNEQVNCAVTSQRSINMLSSEFMKTVARAICKTAEDSRKLKFEGACSEDAVKTAMEETKGIYKKLVDVSKSCVEKQNSQIRELEKLAEEFRIEEINIQLKLSQRSNSNNVEAKRSALPDGSSSEKKLTL